MEPLETNRLILRAPRAKDAQRIYDAYASDPEVTRLVAWPRHRTLEDTRAFLEFSKAQWQQWPVGPLLVWTKQEGELIGSTGLAFETPYRASTGYVISRSRWRQGFASEGLAAMVCLAKSCDVRRLYALCHWSHDASVGVLKRAGFEFEGTLRRFEVFPNLSDPHPQDVHCYAWHS